MKWNTKQLERVQRLGLPEDITICHTKPLAFQRKFVPTHIKTEEIIKLHKVMQMQEIPEDFTIENSITHDIEQDQMTT